MPVLINPDWLDILAYRCHCCTAPPCDGWCDLLGARISINHDATWNYDTGWLPDTVCSSKPGYEQRTITVGQASAALSPIQKILSQWILENNDNPNFPQLADSFPGHNPPYFSAYARFISCLCASVTFRVGSNDFDDPQNWEGQWSETETVMRRRPTATPPGGETCPHWAAPHNTETEYQFDVQRGGNYEIFGAGQVVVRSGTDGGTVGVSDSLNGDAASISLGPVPDPCKWVFSGSDSGSVPSAFGSRQYNWSISYDPGRLGTCIPFITGGGGGGGTTTTPTP